MDYRYEDLAKMIDHALLAPSMTPAELEAGVKMALAYDVASVCIVPFYVKRCAEMLQGSTVAPSTVIGFPNGANATEIKRAEAEQAIAEGCVELDMVININQTLAKNWDYVRRDIQAVIEPAHAADRKVKVIFENCYLEDEHKIALCEICSELNADWVKTSTGFGSSGATIEDIKLMRQHAADHVQVKAAGGIRDLDTLIAFRELGASRCGASRTAAMLDECRERLGMSPVENAQASAGDSSY
ncbi:MAG: deoxyribose-phosphate aldolase [bacterium]|nr:deoxyribose-phosphate aldolase [bacterium]